MDKFRKTHLQIDHTPTLNGDPRNPPPINPYRIGVQGGLALRTEGPGIPPTPPALDATRDAPVDPEVLDRLRRQRERYRRQGRPAPTNTPSRARTLTTPKYRVYTRAFDRKVDHSQPGVSNRVGPDWMANVDEVARQTVAWADNQALIRDFQRMGGETALSVLVDCSGSMLDHKRWWYALVALRALHAIAARTNIAIEVLGFNVLGGTSIEMAESVRQYYRDRDNGVAFRHTARLGDVHHHVFNAFDQKEWPQASAAAVAETINHRGGNIDGEAVHWAYDRIRQRPEAVRSLLVFTDGSPGGEYNVAKKGWPWQSGRTPYYMTRHLQAVTSKIHQRSDIAVFGIGLGEVAALETFYPGYHTNRDLTQLDREVVTFLAEKVYRWL